MPLPTTGYATATVTNPSASLTDFTLLIDLNDLPADWWTACTSSDGTKCRAAKDSDGTELAFDVIGFSTAGTSGWMRVKWSGTLSNSGTQILRIYPSATANTSYAATDTYGRNAVYTGHLLYAPLEDTPDGGTTTDRVKNGLTGTVTAMESGDLQAAKVANGYNFDGAAEYASFPGNTSWEVPGGFTNTGLCYDSVDNALWIGDHTNSDLVKTDLSGNLLATVSIPDQPQGVAYDSSDDTLWWADYNNQAIRHVQMDGTLIESITALGFNPNGLSYDSLTDSVWVAEESTANVKRYSCATLTLAETVAVASPASGLDGVHYEASDDTLWLTNDSGNLIIHASAADGTVLGSWKATDYVEDIVLVDGQLYLCADAEFHGAVADGNRVHRISRLIDTGVGSFTAMLWANVGTLTSTDTLLVHGRPLTAAGWGIYFSSSTNLRVFIRDATTQVQVDRTVTTGSMRHYAIVVDRAADTLAVYENGAIVSTAADISTVTGSVFTTREVLGLGAAVQSGDRHIAALADELQVLSGAKTAAWLAEEYSQSNANATFWGTWAWDTFATVTTAVAASITTTTASLGGEVTADGGDTVTTRGVCYNTTGTPTTSDSINANGSGTGAFSETTSGLTPGTTYYVRAYATNSAGTSYGSEEEFTTLALLDVDIDLPADVAGRRLSQPHFVWNPDNSGNFAEAWWPDLLHLLGGCLIGDQNTGWTLTQLDTMCDLGIAAGVPFAFRTTPWADGFSPADPRTTTDDAAAVAYQDDLIQWADDVMQPLGVVPMVALIDCEVWPASLAPASGQDRVDWFAARADKYQQHVDVLRDRWPNIIIDFYARSAYFPQVNASNVLNGSYSFTNWVSVDDPGSVVSPVFFMPDRLDACKGSMAKIGSENPDAFKALQAPLVWFGSHYKRNNATGTLTTRTSDTAGVFTADATITFIEGEPLELTWAGGTQTVDVDDVTGQVVTFSGGVGTNLPAQSTAMTAGRYGYVDEPVTGMAALATWMKQILKPKYVTIYPGPGLGVQGSPVRNEANWSAALNDYATAWLREKPTAAQGVGGRVNAVGGIKPRST